MNILIDIGHPGHVHLFRPFAQEMIKKGNKVLFTCRQKEFEIELLEAAGFDYISFGKHYKTKWGKIWGLFKFDFMIWKTALKFKPDVFLSHGSIYAAHASFLMGKPHISMEDTGNMEQVRLYKPFTNVILTSDVFHKNFGKMQVIYSSYHELAYLHPTRFTPDPKVLNEFNNKEFTKSILFRFVSWNASHDVGQGGFSNEEKIKIVLELSKKYKIYISSEFELPKELKQFILKTKPNQIHSVLSSVDLFIGEGATMASECVVLGIPAIYVNTMEAGSIDDQEKYGLVHLRSAEEVLGLAKSIIENNTSKQKYRTLRDKLLLDKIDLTDFLIWFISEWPNSFKIMKNNPDYQYRFK